MGTSCVSIEHVMESMIDGGSLGASATATGLKSYRYLHNNLLANDTSMNLNTGCRRLDKRFNSLSQEF